nr:sushi, von Willebrand factor type A, EGF and pentraxin domain-containing protein 1-like [Lytechinus pictus]
MELNLFITFFTLSIALGSPVPECGLPVTLSNVITSPSEISYPLWSKITFSCDGGYSHVGSQYSYCMEGGVWDPSPDNAICMANCAEPDVGQNVVHFPFGHDSESTQSVYNHEDVIQYACAEGISANLVGPNEATCENGLWVPAAMPSCNHCTPPLVSDPKVIKLSPNRQTYATNDEVILSCSDDVRYTAVGTNVTYCKENGEWIPDPTKMMCRENCHLPAHDALVESRPLRKTSVEGDAKISRFNAVISNSCPTGKVLVGPTTQRCVKGKWLPDRKVVCT